MNNRQLLKDEKVLFAGYKVPHPLKNNVVIRVQTEQGYDPKEAIVNAAEKIVTQLAQLKGAFEREWAINTGRI